MRSLTILFLILCLLTACTGDDDGFTLSIVGCEVNNPLEELDWLKTEIAKREQNQSDEMKYCYIVQAIYQEQTIFIFDDCNPLVDKAPGILDCAGSVIGSVGEIDFKNDELTNRNIIYKPSDFACNF